MTFTCTAIPHHTLDTVLAEAEADRWTVLHIRQLHRTGWECTFVSPNLGRKSGSGLTLLSAVVDSWLSEPYQPIEVPDLSAPKPDLTAVLAALAPPPPPPTRRRLI